jgi:hypothetical protein
VGTQVSGDIKSEKVSKKVILQIPRAFEVNEKKTDTILNQRTILLISFGFK